MINRARLFAMKAHDSIGHKRRYTNEPYHVHPARVASLLQDILAAEELIAAAWMHDVLEDVAPKNAAYDANAIRQEFGDHVLKLVLEVTDVSKPSDGNRAMRKSIDRVHLAQASNEGKTIKLADLIDNIIDISKHDPHFARVFKKEVMLDLPVLVGGHAGLYAQLKKLLT